MIEVMLIGVLATEATVRGGAYQRAITQLRPDARVVAIACGLFVALAAALVVYGIANVVVVASGVWFAMAKPRVKPKHLPAAQPS